MRTFVLGLFALFAFVPALAATEVKRDAPHEARLAPSVQMEAPAPEVPAMHLTEISMEERHAQTDAAAAQVAQRGSFWWLVGVVVVAGVILAVLL